MSTSRQGEARAIASGLDHKVDTTRGKVTAEVTCPTPADTKRVLTAFGRAGWKTSVSGNLVLAEVQP